MKAKQIKRSILAILMIVVLMVGTSVISVGAETQKTYLDTIPYTEFKTDNPNNSVDAYEGYVELQYGDTVLPPFYCSRAVKFFVDTNEFHYNDNIRNIGEASCYVTYNLNKEYSKFSATLTKGEFCKQKKMNVKIYGDDNLIYDQNLSYAHAIVNPSVENVDVLKIVISYSLAICDNDIEESYGNVLLYNAYFTSEGTTPEPTTKAPETTQKPTQAPTKPIVNPTVAPTTKNPVVAPTKDVEDTTKATVSSQESTSSKTNPTASTNATSKVSTGDTATKDSTNKGISSSNRGNSDNGTIQTGAVSIAVILFVILASLATGGFVWYRRKIK